jgi:hypothetical protein
MLPIRRILFSAALVVTAAAANAQEAAPAVSAQEAAPASAAVAPSAPAAATAATPSAVADTPVNPNYRDEPSWMPPVDPKQGLVIIFRERHFVGGGAKMKLYYDDQAFTPLKNGKFVYAYMAPGDHTIYGDKKKKSDARLLAIEPGEVHFFEATIQMGMWKAATDLLETDPAVAKDKISALQKH